jgi:hypothetical protein
MPDSRSSPGLVMLRSTNLVYAKKPGREELWREKREAVGGH